MLSTVRIIPTPGQGDGIDAFFKRCGLSPDTQFKCLATVRDLFPNANIEEASPQGYCSYTLCVGHNTVVQFRSLAHQINIKLTQVAQDIYGDLAPGTELLETSLTPYCCCCCCSCSTPPLEDEGSKSTRDTFPVDEGIALGDDRDCHRTLQAISMTRIPGVSLAELRATTTTTTTTTVTWGEHQPLTPTQTIQRQRESLISQFAGFIAQGWRHRRPSSDPIVLDLRGRVGGSITWRLNQMQAHLPVRFQSTVQAVLDHLDHVASLPWVLSHGDIVPANVMVQCPPGSGACEDGVLLTGFLDWAEAEYLPFGVGLYGLEEFLGESSDGTNGRFTYYPEAAKLRAFFWSRLEAELSDVETKPNSGFRRDIETAHALGILLWHGIAFDDGRLNRVVEEGRDEEEIRRLDLFFASCRMVAASDSDYPPRRQRNSE